MRRKKTATLEIPTVRVRTRRIILMPCRGRKTISVRECWITLPRISFLENATTGQA